MKSTTIIITVLSLVFLVLLMPEITPSAAAADAATFEAYGYLKADMIYDFKRILSPWNATMRPSQIVIPATETVFYDEGEFIYSLKPTRFGVNISLPTDGSTVTGKLEIDFFGVGSNAGQQLPRLRQAYVRYGSLLAGQAWSLFNDTEIWPITMDFWGPAGVLASRRPQLRWTALEGTGSILALALEQPGAGVDAGKGPQFDPDLDVRPRSVLPDFTAQYRTHGESGYLQVAGVVRELGYEGSFDPVTGIAATGDPTFAGSVMGWGLYLSGHWRTAAKGGLLASVAYGEGIANYANDGGVDVAPDDDLEPEALPFFLWHVAYDNWWNARWSTSLGASQAIQENSGGQNDDAFRIGSYAFVNLVHHPQAGLSYGLEFLWGEREDKDGASNDDYRLQFSTKFAF